MITAHHRSGYILLLGFVAATFLCAGWYVQRRQADTAETIGRVTLAAQAFLSSLDDEQLGLVHFAFDHEERKDWSNLPYFIHERRGLRFGDMSPESRMQAHRLLQTVLSSQGYLKASGIMRLDDIRDELSSSRMADGSRRFGSEFYWIGIFGTPHPDSVWGWQLDGHHLALNFTVAGDRIAVTPAFMGADPAEVREGANTGWRILGEEDDRGLAMISSLTPEQQGRAVIADSAGTDVLAGPGRADAIQRYEGLSAADMSRPQREQLIELIEKYAHNLEHDVAHDQMERLQNAGLDNVYFAWMGPVDPGPRDRYYYRIHGPTMLIEFDNSEPPGQAGADVNHIHTIWRDPANDYGEDLLRRHYETSPHHRGG